MGIPTSQLETWSRLPDPARSAHTYDVVQKALAQSNLKATYSFDRYLQGSYANATNIRADSDVDVVVEMESTFRRNIELLSPPEQTRYEADALPGTHSLTQFKKDVRAALEAYFGASKVTEGNKCLKVEAFQDRLPIDVLPCQEYRLYRRYRPVGEPDYAEGVFFRTRDGRGVINYPKIHRKNGELKQARTNNMYKPIVRTVKNARRKLAEDGVIDKSVSPSYFVECLLYNVPDAQFSPDLRLAYVSVLVWLGENIQSLAGMKCQNGIVDLFGPTPEQWDIPNAQRLIAALLTQWSNWS